MHQKERDEETIIFRSHVTEQKTSSLPTVYRNLSRSSSVGSTTEQRRRSTSSGYGGQVSPYNGEQVSPSNSVQASPSIGGQASPSNVITEHRYPASSGRNPSQRQLGDRVQNGYKHIKPPVFNNRYTRMKMQKEVLIRTKDGFSAFFELNRHLLLKNAWEKEIIPRKTQNEKTPSTQTQGNIENNTIQLDFESPTYEEQSKQSQITEKASPEHTVKKNVSTSAFRALNENLFENINQWVALEKNKKEIEVTTSTQDPVVVDSGTVDISPEFISSDESESEEIYAVPSNKKTPFREIFDLTMLGQETALDTQKDVDHSIEDDNFITVDHNMKNRCRRYLANRSCSKGNECKYLHSMPKDDNITCKLFEEGKCMRSVSECWYKHAEQSTVEGAMANKSPSGNINSVDDKMKNRCRRYLASRSCFKGSACKFLHALPKDEDILCKGFEEGNCPRSAAECWYKHTVQTVDEGNDSDSNEGPSPIQSVGNLLSQLRNSIQNPPKNSKSMVSDQYSMKTTATIKTSRPKHIGTPTKKTSLNNTSSTLNSTLGTQKFTAATSPKPKSVEIFSKNKNTEIVHRKHPLITLNAVKEGTGGSILTDAKKKLSAGVKPVTQHIIQKEATVPTTSGTLASPAVSMPGKVASSAVSVSGKVASPAVSVPGKVVSSAVSVPGKVAVSVPGKVARSAVLLPGKAASPAASVPGKVASPAVSVPGKASSAVLVPKKKASPTDFVPRKVATLTKKAATLTKPAVSVPGKLVGSSVSVLGKGASPVVSGKVATQACPTVSVPRKVASPAVSEPGKVATLASPAVSVPGKGTNPSVSVPGKVTKPSVLVAGKVASPAVSLPGKVASSAVSVPGKVASSAVSVPGKVASQAVSVPGKVASPAVSVLGKGASSVDSSQNVKKGINESKVSNPKKLKDVELASVSTDVPKTAKSCAEIHSPSLTNKFSGSIVSDSSHAVNVIANKSKVKPNKENNGMQNKEIMKSPVTKEVTKKKAALPITSEAQLGPAISVIPKVGSSVESSPQRKKHVKHNSSISEQLKNSELASVTTNIPETTQESVEVHSSLTNNSGCNVPETAYLKNGIGNKNMELLKENNTLERKQSTNSAEHKDPNLKNEQMKKCSRTTIEPNQKIMENSEINARKSSSHNNSVSVNIKTCESKGSKTVLGENKIKLNPKENNDQKGNDKKEADDFINVKAKGNGEAVEYISKTKRKDGVKVDNSKITKDESKVIEREEIFRKGNVADKKDKKKNENNKIQVEKHNENNKLQIEKKEKNSIGKSDEKQEHKVNMRSPLKESKPKAKKNETYRSRISSSDEEEDLFSTKSKHVPKLKLKLISGSEESMCVKKSTHSVSDGKEIDANNTLIQESDATNAVDRTNVHKKKEIESKNVKSKEEIKMYKKKENESRNLSKQEKSIDMVKMNNKQSISSSSDFEKQRAIKGPNTVNGENKLHKKEKRLTMLKENKTAMKDKLDTSSSSEVYGTSKIEVENEMHRKRKIEGRSSVMPEETNVIGSSNTKTDEPECKKRKYSAAGKSDNLKTAMTEPGMINRSDKTQSLDMITQKQELHPSTSRNNSIGDGDIDAQKEFHKKRKSNNLTPTDVNNHKKQKLNITEEVCNLDLVKTEPQEFDDSTLELSSAQHLTRKLEETIKSEEFEGEEPYQKCVLPKSETPLEEPYQKFVLPPKSETPLEDLYEIANRLLEVNKDNFEDLYQCFTDFFEAVFGRSPLKMLKNEDYNNKYIVFEANLRILITYLYSTDDKEPLSQATKVRNSLQKHWELEPNLRDYKRKLEKLSNESR